VAGVTADDRALPLRERKKLRTRRALADTALRMFSEKGFAETTLEELVDAAEVSKSTFFRAFPAKEAVAIEAEAELWSAYVSAVRERRLSGNVLGELRDSLVATVTALPDGWDERYLATRRLVAVVPALVAYVQHYRADVVRELAGCMADKLAVGPDDMRPPMLAELTVAAWSLAGRGWVRSGGPGGRATLLERLANAFHAIPASLDLTVP
jgi:AcrR family transcriptional regulator